MDWQVIGHESLKLSIRLMTTVAADPDFGTILLEQKPNKGNIGNGIFLLVCGICCLAFGLLTTLLMSLTRLSISGGAAFIIVGSLLCGFTGIMLRRHWMHVFLQERGIREYRQRQGRSLRYDDVDELTYSSLRIFMSGFYIHTVQKLALKSHGLQGPPLVSTLIFKEADGRSAFESQTALTDVRDRISSVIDERLLEALGREGTVDWTPESRIGARGLDLADRKGTCHFVEWRRVSKMEAWQGMLRLWVDSEVNPRLETTTAQPNFFPAYSLALRLWEQGKMTA